MNITHLFNKLNIPNLENVLHDPKAMRKMSKIAERARLLKIEMEQHCSKHRKNWIKQEAQKLYDQHNNNRPKPTWSPALIPSDYLKTATLRVDSRIEGRLQNLETTSRRMQHNIAQDSHADLREKLALRAEIKNINRAFHKLQINLSRDFDKNKEKWIQEARREGLDKPEIAARTAYEHRQGDIERERLHAVRQAYQRRGIDYDPRIMLTHEMNNAE